MWALWAVVAGYSDGPATDHHALDRMADGDHDALAEIYDRHGRIVYSLALRIVRNTADAEDIVQEVFSQAWREAARYRRSRGSVVAWLINLARSRAIDRLRRRHARPESQGDESTVSELPDLAAPVDERLVSAERAARLSGALGELSVLQRIAIELAFYEGLTYVEVAERLEVPLGTIKTRIRQGLLKLRDLLAEESS